MDRRERSKKTRGIKKKSKQKIRKENKMKRMKKKMERKDNGRKSESTREWKRGRGSNHIHTCTIKIWPK